MLQSKRKIAGNRNQNGGHDCPACAVTTQPRPRPSARRADVIAELVRQSGDNRPGHARTRHCRTRRAARSTGRSRPSKIQPGSHTLTAEDPLSPDLRDALDQIGQPDNAH